jgi:TonB family protein
MTAATGLLLESTVKTSIVVLIAMATASLLRRQSAAVRHWILASAIACAALTPVLGSVVPSSWQVPIGIDPATGWFDARDRSQNAPLAATEGLRDERTKDDSARSDDRTLRPRAWPAITTLLPGAIVTIWTAGAAISLLILVLGLGRLAWIASHARRVLAGRWTESAAHVARDYGLHRPVQLLQTDHPTLLVTWGCARPRILLPRAAQQWSEDRVRIVLSHELAHIKRRDWAIQMLAEIARAAYWFNPLIWIACRRLREESEHATDDAVLRQGMTGPEYARHLLELARVLTDRSRGTWLPAAAIAPSSSLERRVRAMLNDRTNRAPATRSARTVMLAAVACLTVALAAAQGAFATFSGTVFDETNGFVPGVTLVLTNPQSQAKYEVISDRTGHFEFVGLPPGDYQLETKVAGFATLRGTLTLTGQNAQRDLVLQIGSLEETITVRGGPRTVTGSLKETITVRGDPGTDPTRSGASDRPARRPDPTCTSLPAGGMGGNIRAPHKLVDVKPYYPQHLYDTNIGGTVVLQARIDTEGRVSAVEVVSPAHPDLNAAAIEAVRQWEFDSTILNCRKVEVAMKVTVNFVAR